MEDILEVYKLPYSAEEPIICIDESSKQLIKEVRDKIPVKSGKPEKYDSEYERNGVCNLFMIFAPLEGWRHIKVTERRTKIDWAECIKELVDVYFPDAEKIILVQDNLNTHKPSSLYEAFPPEEAMRLLKRLEFHYTPKHGSWLDMAEIELSTLMSQCLDRRIEDQQTLKNEIAAWEKQRNSHSAKVNWRFTAEDARIKLKRLYPTKQS
jgi:hypothetical protein